MAKSVRELPNEVHELIDHREWDMRTHEGVQRFQELRARSLPCIAIDGELVYESLIPGQEELIAELRRRHREKAGR